MTSKQLAKNRTRKKLEQKNLFSSACWWRSSAGTRRRRSRESTASAASPWLTTSRGTFRNLDIFWFQKRKKKRRKEKIWISEYFGTISFKMLGEFLIDICLKSAPRNMTERHFVAFWHCLAFLRTDYKYATRLLHCLPYPKGAESYTTFCPYTIE